MRRPFGSGRGLPCPRRRRGSSGANGASRSMLDRPCKTAPEADGRRLFRSWEGSAMGFGPRRSRRRRRGLTRAARSVVGRTERSGRAASDRTTKRGADIQRQARRDGLCDVAWLARRQRVRLGGDRRLRDRLGSRPRARHQSCVSDCIFLDRRGRGHLERDPADFAKTASLNRNSPLSRAELGRIKTCGARLPEPNGTPRWGGAEPLAGRFSLATRRTTTRTRGRGDGVGTGDQSDPPICPSSCRFDSGRGSRRLADQFRPLHVACGRAQLPSGGDRRARRIRRSGPHAGHGGNGVRICGRHGALLRRRGGDAVFPVASSASSFSFC